jgi:hypothetical protein
LFIDTSTGGQNRRRATISQVLARPVKSTFQPFPRQMRGPFAAIRAIVKQSLVFLPGKWNNTRRQHEKSLGYR